MKLKISSWRFWNLQSWDAKITLNLVNYKRHMIPWLLILNPCGNWLIWLELVPAKHISCSSQNFGDFESFFRSEFSWLSSRNWPKDDHLVTIYRVREDWLEGKYFLDLNPRHSFSKFDLEYLIIVFVCIRILNIWLY